MNCWDAAIDAKIALSDAQSVTVNVAGWQGEITRNQFSELIAPLVKRTLLACRRALKDAGVEGQRGAGSGHGWRLNPRAAGARARGRILLAARR